MKSGQCPKCGSRDVFCNTNRKFPALHTITVGAGSFGNRYAPLDVYICVTCGYVESYIAHPEDLSYIKQEWALATVKGDRDSLAAPTELPDATSYLKSSANGHSYPLPNPSEERSTGNGTASGSAMQ